MGNKCGTLAGFYRHRRIREECCDACLKIREITRRKKPKCGTYSGYYKHIRNKEETCIPCRKAQAEYARKKYAENPERSKKRVIEYRKKNIENAKKSVAKWAKNNPDKIRSIARKRRAKKANNQSSPYTEQEVLKTYGFNCHICLNPIDINAPRRTGRKGWENGLHIDHVIPISKGGPDTLENVRPSHGACNVRKKDSILDKDSSK